MIFEFFVSVALDVVSFGAELLPDVDIGTPGLGPAFAIMLTFDSVIPVGTMLQGALVLLAVTGLLFLVKVIQTVVAHLPGIGGGGA